MSYEIWSGPGRTLGTIPDLAGAIAGGFIRGVRQQVAAAAFGATTAPLIPGTEEFAAETLAAWHRGQQTGQKRDVACYILKDAAVTGTGQIWVDGRLVTAPEIMPPYVVEALAISAGGADALHYCAGLPKRTISEPCLVAVGPATKTYGHFLIEMLFRILVAGAAWPTTERLPYKVLLDAGAPSWLLRILAEDLGISADSIEKFQPWQEQVVLRHAILPSRIFLDLLMHPVASQLVEDLVERLRISIDPNSPQRIFVARGLYRTPDSQQRICKNEQELYELSVERHGLAVVRPENMHWREQIALFRRAEIVIGLAGSGLHNAIFCQPGSRVGSIGFMNFVQSEIGGVRSQRNGYLTKGVKMNFESSVGLADFELFMQAMCA